MQRARHPSEPSKLVLLGKGLQRWCVVCVIAVVMIVAWEVGFLFASMTRDQDTVSHHPREFFEFGVEEPDVVKEENVVNVGDSGHVIHDVKAGTSHVVTQGKDRLAETERIQSARRRLLESECRRLQLKSNVSNFSIRHILVNEKYRLAYCFVPKVGCSNWKRILMVLDGQRDTVEGLTSDEVHINGDFRFLSSYPPRDREQILRDYFKFVFVRHPFERLVSVFKNKLADVTSYRRKTAFHRFGREMIKSWRPDPSDAALATGENVTWPEFVKYLTHTVRRHKMENDYYTSDHWREMFKVCSPCGLNFDFVGNLETVVDDAQYLFEKWNVRDKVYYLGAETSRPTNSSQEYEAYFSQLSAEDLGRLWSVYQNDFTLFGYERPSFVPSDV
ncbi:carbohydrate sulfotransferase 11-like [Diadema antillarum]|uniref:carbohydrate sulfotransferase 11-like n=1 Tax=Diadema antillarum TaxID=105358 RepID=UPI003A86E4E0